MNEQQPIGARYDADACIDVHSVFQTIQGEGPFCGSRALFIRLHGCNLRCPGCDTEYTNVRDTHSPEDVLELVQHVEEWPTGALIVITGGEPFRQNVVPTILALLDADYVVQVETNGVLCPPGFDALTRRSGFTLVCSPKTSRIDPTIAARADAFKYVLRADDMADDGLPTRALGHVANPHVARPGRANVPVYLQPMDEQDEIANAVNTTAVVVSCMRHGYILQLQTHKLLGLE